MTPLTSTDIRGNWGTLLLPLEADDSINFNKLALQIDRLIGMKVNGIYSNGTAAEFHNQTEAEFDRISALLAEKCNQAGMPFQIGVNHTNPAVTLERIKRVLPLEPGAIQVILPDWFPPVLPEIIDYLRVVTATANGIGIVLYNPPHAKRRLSPQDFSAIRQAGIPLVGCKLPGGDAQWYADMQAAWPGLSLFIPGHHLATGLRAGAHGAYSNVACLHPGAAQQWYETMLTDMEKALLLEKRIQAFMSRHIGPLITEKGYSNAAVDKLLACLTGWADLTPRLRWPYRWIGEAELAAVKAACREMLPEFFI